MARCESTNPRDARMQCTRQEGHDEMHRLGGIAWTGNEAPLPREVTMSNRAMVAGIASRLIDDGDREKGDALIGAVRCCGEFPECAHILDWLETRS
jgi:hypothetical protein